MAPAVKVHKAQRFIVDCTAPMQDNIIDASGLEKFFHDRIKVDGKCGQLGTKVQISRQKGRITVLSEVPISKRYLKYLTKKYLKKQQIRDFLRVVATSKGSYEVRYFNISNDAGEE
ncbi:60S ribosomal protein L22 [Cryptosporidium felis]|nr:60S ribosomal protein L22 [Cryptosporidium felis]